MKYACDKCLRVGGEIEVKGWLKVKSLRGGTEYLLCPKCEDGFWKAVDSEFRDGLPKPEKK